MNDLISIIVPVFQVAAYLPTCIESVLQQTYRNIEIILVDDGSTDESSDICDIYAQKDSRIRVIHKRNNGLVSARKAAMQIARGQLIGYVDSDDWIDPDMYEIMYTHLKKSDSDIVITGHVEEVEGNSFTWINSIPAGIYKDKELEDKVYPNMLYDSSTHRWALSPACWDKLFRREVVETHQMLVHDQIWDGEDHAFTYPAVLGAKSICILDSALYHHRRRKDSIAFAYDERAFERIGYLYQGLKHTYQNSGYWGILERPFSYQIRWFLLKHMRMELKTDEYDNGEAVRPYLFPFSSVCPGSDIVLYGAGNVGEVYHRQIVHSGYCNIVAWVSKDYEKRGGLIKSPKLIKSQRFDYVVIAVLDYSVAMEIRKELEEVNISWEKIVWRSPLMETLKKG